MMGDTFFNKKQKQVIDKSWKAYILAPPFGDVIAALTAA